MIIEYSQLYEGDTIKVNAPNILSLSIQDFWVTWNVLLIYVSSLVKTELDYKLIDLELDDITYEEEEENMPKRFILDLGHVKELKLGNHCF